MNGEYDVFMGDQVVGTAHVERQGLYYRFFCRCRLSGDTICRVSVSCGGHQESLGILVPKDGQFETSTRVAAKKLGQGTFRFRVLPRHSAMQEKFICVYPEEPFAYISRLKEAYLQERRGRLGIVIPGSE